MFVQCNINVIVNTNKKNKTTNIGFEYYISCVICTFFEHHAGTHSHKYIYNRFNES